MSLKGAKRWLVLYRTALLELDLQKMPERIALTSTALQERLRESQGCGSHYGEKLEIAYAIRNLRVAERMKEWRQNAPLRPIVIDGGEGTRTT